MSVVPGPSGDLHHHLGYAASHPREPDGRIAAVPARRTQHRRRDPGAPDFDGRTQHLLETAR